MDKELIPQGENNKLTEQSFNEIMSLSSIFAASGSFPDAKTQAEAAVKIIAGRTFGLDPIAAMNGI
jgi:hypothetical protein